MMLVCDECGEVVEAVSRGLCEWCAHDAAEVKKISVRFHKDDHSELRTDQEMENNDST